jgi:hypothetical protein
VNSPFRTLLLDRFGVLLSGICLLHCLALPALVATVPVVGSAWLDESHAHGWLFAAALPTSLIALGWGVRQHGRHWIGALGLIGVLLLAYAWLGHREGSLGIAADRVITSIGGLLLASAHALNLRSGTHCTISVHPLKSAGRGG